MESSLLKIFPYFLSPTTMPNIVPMSSNLDEDPMSSELRKQFRSVQAMHQNHILSQQKSKDGSVDNETDEESFSDHPDLHLSSSSSSSPNLGCMQNQSLIDMAFSTSISAQSEINSLLNGISDLENMIAASNSTTVTPNTSADTNIIGKKTAKPSQCNDSGLSLSHLATAPVDSNGESRSVAYCE